MILYKKMVRFYSSTRVGFKDEITPITNWMDEDKIREEDKKKIEETKKRPFTRIRQKTEYVFVKEED